MVFFFCIMYKFKFWFWLLKFIVIVYIFRGVIFLFEYVFRLLFVYNVYLKILLVYLVFMWFSSVGNRNSFLIFFILLVIFGVNVMYFLNMESI